MTDDVSMTAAEFSLGTLTAFERKVFARRLADDASLRADVAFWNDRLAPLAEAVEPVEPSSNLWSRIEQATDDMESGANVVTLRRQASRWRMIAMGSTALAACMTLIVSLRVVDLAGVAPAPIAQQTTGQLAVLAGEPKTGVETASAQRPLAPLDAAAPAQIVVASTPLSGLPQGGVAPGAIQAASAPRDQGDPVVGGGSISTASGTRDLGGLSVGGQIIPGPGGLRENVDKIIHVQPGAAQNAIYVAALTRVGDAPAISVRVDRTRRTIQLNTPDFTALEGKQLQAWILPLNGAPRALGPVSGTQAWLAFPADVAFDDATIAVSAEPNNNLSNATPMGEILYRGRLTGN